MKNVMMMSLITLMTLAAHAGNIASSKMTIAPSSVDQVVRLVDKTAADYTQKKVSVVVTDHGMSTDVSPRHTVYLTLASLAEMGNIFADFKINDNVFEFISATRKSAGVYEVKTVEYRGEAGMTEVTQTIDATKLFADEKALRASCGGDFCDKELKSSVSVTEVTQLKK